MRVIAVVNSKGGSGKTTTAVNLAAALGEVKRRCLVIDLDPQHSSTFWFGAPDGSAGLLMLFEGETELEDLVLPTETPGVEIVPSSAWLASVERIGYIEKGKDRVLQRSIRNLDHAWDYILIDCAPGFGFLAVSALAAAQEIIIPVETHVMAANGVAHLLSAVEAIKEQLNPDLKIAGILPCRADFRTRHTHEVIQLLHDCFGKLVYKTAIRENVRVAEAPSFRQPITIYDSNCAAAEDYRALAREVVKQEVR